MEKVHGGFEHAAHALHRHHAGFSDGRLRHRSINGVPIFDANGTFTGYRGTGRDVTSRVEMTLLLRNVIDAMPAFVNAKDPEGRFLLIPGNPLTQFPRLLGLLVESPFLFFEAVTFLGIQEA